MCGKLRLLGLRSLAKPTTFGGRCPPRKSSFPVVNQPHHTGVLVYGIRCSVGVCIGGTGIAHASITQKAKNTQSILVLVPASGGFSLCVVTLAGAHENTGMVAA